MFTSLKDVEVMKKPELDAIIAAYVQLGVGDDAPKGMVTNAVKVEYITKKATEVGKPHTVTAEDIQKDPSLADGGIEAGKLVLIDHEEPESAPAAQQEPPKNDDSKESEQKETTNTPGTNQKAPAAKSEAKDAAKNPNFVAQLIQDKKLFYEGQLIIAVSNRVAAGKLMKELDAGTSRYTVTAEEFETLIGKFK